MSKTAGQIRRAAVVFIVAAGATLGAGCVRRTMTINTQPQGATVTLNDEVIGTSPVSKDFLWYGDYDVIVRKEGYQTLKTNQRLKAPWYQSPMVDVFAEILVPLEFHDRQQMSFELTPAKEVNSEQLIQDARQLKDKALQGTD